MPRTDDDQALSARIAAGLAKLGLATRHAAWREAGPRGLTPTQRQVLSVLRAQRAGGETRVSDVAAGLAVTLATASAAVTTLVRKDLVVKERSGTDGRAILLRLTRTGSEEAERSGPCPGFLRDAVDSLTPPEQASLLRALVKLVRALQERGEIPVSQTCVTCRFFRPNVHDDPTGPHHCDFVDASFGDGALRFDCPEHEQLGDVERGLVWDLFLQDKAGAGSAVAPDIGAPPGDPKG